MTRRNMTRTIPDRRTITGTREDERYRDGYEHLIALVTADSYRTRIADLEDQIRDREATIRLLKAQLQAIQDT